MRRMLKRKQERKMHALTKGGPTLNRSKFNKFKKFLKSGLLPPWLVTEYERIMSLTTSKRTEPRSLVNEVVAHDACGKLVLALEKPQFKSFQKSFEASEAAETEKSLPKILLMGKFNLSETQFEAALESGELVEVTTRGGKTQFAWSSSSHSTKRGKVKERGFEKEKEGSLKDENADFSDEEVENRNVPGQWNSQQQFAKSGPGPL